MPRDQVTLRPNEFHPKPLEVEQIEGPTICFSDETVRRVLLGCRKRLRTHEHQHVGLMAQLMHTPAVVFKFCSPIGSYRVGEYDFASQTVLADDSVATSITGAAEGVDACITG